MNKLKDSQGFFLLDAVLSLLIISLLLGSFFLYITSASEEVMKTKIYIETMVQESNINASLLYENKTQ